MGAELFHKDGRTDGGTDMTKLTVVFRNSANAPKNKTLAVPTSQSTHSLNSYNLKVEAAGSFEM